MEVCQTGSLPVKDDKREAFQHEKLGHVLLTLTDVSWGPLRKPCSRNAAAGDCYHKSLTSRLGFQLKLERLIPKETEQRAE